MTEELEIGRRTQSKATGVTRRTFLQLAGGAAALGLLSACAPSSSGGATGGAAPAATTGGAAPAATTGGAKGFVVKGLGADYLAYPDLKGTIQFSNCWDGARVSLVDKWTKDFNTIYPGITVESDLSPCTALQQKQITSIAGGSAPNVMMVKSDTTAFYAKQDALLPLDDLMKRDGVKAEQFYPAEFTSRTWGGKTYGLPNVTAGGLHLLFANTGLLEKVGWDPKKPLETWQDLETLAGLAKKQGLFVMDPAKISTGQTIHFVLTYANGGQYWDDNLTKIKWNEPAGLEAAEWLLKFVKMQADKYENLAFASDPKNVLQADQWGKSGKYIAMINLTSTFFTLAQKAPEVKYAAYTFPRNANNPNSKGNTPTTGGWMFSIAKAGKDQAAAWEWIKFTTVSKNACSFAEAQNRPAPVRQCNENPELAKNNPYWPVVTKDLANDIFVPTTSYQPQFTQMWLDMEDAILYEKMTPKEALDSYAEKGQALLDKWNAEQKKS